jgi:hypothetical protein
VAGANFALGWIRKWHPGLNFSSMSLSLPAGRATLQVHMDATLQPTRRISARLLQEDARFFCEYHYMTRSLWIIQINQCCNVRLYYIYIYIYIGQDYSIIMYRIIFCTS